MSLRTRTITLAAAVVAAAAVLPGLPAAAAAAGCAVTYATPSQWPGGFIANVTVTNLGDAINGWNLTWAFTGGQQVQQAWSATVTQNATQVSATNMSYNAQVATNGTVSFGFNGVGSASPPASFSLNGAVCTGGVDPGPGPGPGALPSSYQWSSSGALIGPKTDASHPIVSVKDPTVVRYDNQWLVYMTTANTGGAWSLAYTSFSDWAQASAAPLTYLDQNPNIGTGYRAAPQLFYFAPKNTWYLVYQQGPPAFSTASSPTQPGAWTAPRNFIDQEPAIVTANKGSGGWLDFWVICDSVNCYLFFSDDNGHLYRAQTTVANFPNGFGNTQIVLSDSRFALFEAANVYKVKGVDQYLLLVEAIGSDGRRYFRSWTSTTLGGSWTALANTESNPFARASNVTFPNGQWTRDISHGEMIRSGYDQTLEIDPCRLQYLYQGMDPNASGDYSQLPWRLGLLTQTNSTC